MRRRLDAFVREWQERGLVARSRCYAVRYVCWFRHVSQLKLKRDFRNGVIILKQVQNCHPAVDIMFLLLLPNLIYLAACASASIDQAGRLHLPARDERFVPVPCPIKAEITANIRYLHGTNHQSNGNGIITDTSSYIFIVHSPK